MKILRLLYLMALIVVVYGCQKWDYYRQFVPDGEKKYPSIDTTFITRPGNERLQLKWKHTNDPTVNRYIIYWNSNRDSLIYTTIPAANDTIYLYLSIPEAVYDFTIYSYDTQGNKSVPRRIPAARVYGTNYIGSLYNRGLRINDPYVMDENGELTVNFSVSSETEVYTEIQYTNDQDETTALPLGRDEVSITLADYKLDTDISYRSYYKPAPDAIDTFHVKDYTILKVGK